MPRSSRAIRLWASASISSAPAASMASTAAAQSGNAVADVVDALTSALEESRDRGTVADRGEKLDERLGDCEQCLSTPSSARIPFASARLGRRSADSSRHRSLEIVHCNGDMVDLGHHRGRWSMAAHRPILLKTVILSSPISSRKEGSSIPSPFSGARQRTPTLPSCWFGDLHGRLAYFAQRIDTDKVGWTRPRAISLLASHASL